MTLAATRGRWLITGILGFAWLNFAGTQLWTRLQPGRGASMAAVVTVGLVLLGLTIGLLRGTRWVRWAAVLFFVFCGIRIVAWAWGAWPDMRAQGVSPVAFASMLATGVVYLVSGGLLVMSGAIVTFGEEMRAREGTGTATVPGAPA
jgi:hypothetical protein